MMRNTRVQPLDTLVAGPCVGPCFSLNIDRRGANCRHPAITVKRLGGRMPRVTRRRFLQISGAGAAAAQTGGVAGLLATGGAPAYAQQTMLHWLRWNDFVPASDQLVKTK